jgi:DNA-binding MarR family transcriptional regulator
MTQAIKADLQDKLIVGYTNAVKQAQRAQKGLRNQYLQFIMLVGRHPEGLRCVDAANIAGMSLHNAYQRLHKSICAGYTYKENKRYYLTDSGRSAYNAVCKQFDATLEEIIKELVKEAARRSDLG